MFKGNSVSTYLRSGSDCKFYGGAVFIMGNIGVGYTWAISNSTFVRNSVTATGASTFSGSVTVTMGGAVGTYVTTGFVNVTRCSFSSNSVSMSMAALSYNYFAGGGRSPMPPETVTHVLRQV